METKDVAQNGGRTYLPYILVGILALVAVILYAGSADGRRSGRVQSSTKQETSREEDVVLPIHWNNLGVKLVAAGAIDKEKFIALYAAREALAKEAEALLSDTKSNPVIMTRENAPLLLNLLWAFGLANQNAILEYGPMMDPRYGSPGGFASVGGWTLATGDPLLHYSYHPFVLLTDTQQEKVLRVSQGIYRPCCGNATYFPDCNHGMAMLGLLELMAAEGISENEMYRVALQVNAHWFPDTYLTIAEYLKKQNTPWADTDPKVVLGANYSSAEGYRRIVQELAAPKQGSGTSCGV